MNAIADHPQSALAAEPIWRRMRASFQRAVAEIGAPAVIAALSTLTRKLRRTIAERILRLEHLVRKLLLAEAVAIRRTTPALCVAADAHKAPLTTSSFTAATPSARAQPDLTQPDTWSARFALAPPRDPRRVPEALAPRLRSLWGPTPPEPPPPPQRAPRVFDEAETPFRLARRLEALRRVLENPAPYAVRLARLLTRLVRSHPEIVRTYALSPARTAYYDPIDPRVGIDAFGACFCAEVAFTDSS